MKYNKKFRIYNNDGSVNKNGPGYLYNIKDGMIVTNNIVYHQNINNIIAKQNLLEKKQQNRVIIFI
jgi:hypothetical protein